MPRYEFLITAGKAAEVMPCGSRVTSSPARLARWCRRHVAGVARKAVLVYWPVDRNGNTLGEGGVRDLAARAG